MKKLLALLFFLPSTAFSYIVKEYEQNKPIEIWVNDGTIKKSTTVQSNGLVNFHFGVSGAVVTSHPDASPSVRGLMNTGTQTLGGVKTFQSAPVFSSLGTGVLRSSSGVLSTSLIVDADVGSTTIDGSKVGAAGSSSTGAVTSSGTQTFGGNKTFNGSTTLNGPDAEIAGVFYDVEVSGVTSVTVYDAAALPLGRVLYVFCKSTSTTAYGDGYIQRFSNGTYSTTRTSAGGGLSVVGSVYTGSVGAGQTVVCRYRRVL